MLYVLIEAQRAWLDKVQKDSQLIKRETRTISDVRGFQTEQPGLGVRRPPLPKEPVPSLLPSQIQDSKWFTLSPQERLAWAKTSRDPRIAEGQQSPLEKRLLSLGGVHTTAARHLVTQGFREESKELCREQAHSLDYWLAKAESYYNKRMVEMIKREDACRETKVEGETAPRAEGQKPHYWVPEREKRHIERHILRAGQARECKVRTWRQPQLLSETTLPRIAPEKHSVPKAQRQRQVKEREMLQIKDHQERMTRGRELLEQKLKERILRKSQSQIPPLERRRRVKKEIKELEKVVAYPLYQPSSTSQIKVDILREKPQDEEEVSTVRKPCARRFLAVPPFLRTQIGKIKDQ